MIGEFLNAKLPRFYWIGQGLTSLNFDTSLAEVEVFAYGVIHGAANGREGIGKMGED